MKIRMKIMLGFALIALIGLGLGAIGLIGIQRITSLSLQTDATREDYLRAADVLSAHYEWRHGLIMAVSDETVFTGSTDPTTCALGSWLAESEGNIQDEEIQALLEQVHAPHEHIHHQAEAVNALILAGNHDAALQLFEEAVLPQTNETIALIGQIEHRYSDMMHALSEQTVAVRAREMKFMGAAIALAAALCVALTAFLIRSIMKPITQATQCARKVAAGELDAQLHIATKDELGQMAGSFNQVIESLRALTADVELLVEAAEQGTLSTRADASLHKGAYKGIVEGINATLGGLVAPIQDTVEILQEMAQGNLSTRLRGSYRGDYLVMQAAVNDTLEQLERYIHTTGRSLGAMAGGDFDIAITEVFLGDFSVLRDSINTISISMSDTLARIHTAAEQVAAGTQQVSLGAQSVSQGATEQASAIQQISATMTELAEHVQKTAKNAHETSRQAAETRRQSEAGTAAMGGMQRAMSDINDSAAGISRIIKVIEEIAFQTNILSLNAAVEAARAGAHGKGFAVVAEEVRTLAGKCAEAAQETTNLIESSILKAQAGTEIAGETARCLEGIAVSVDRAVVTIENIALASREEAAQIVQTNKGVEQMSIVVQGNSTAAEQAAAAAEELSSQSALLKQMVGRFRLRRQVAAQERAPQPARLAAGIK